MATTDLDYSDSPDRPAQVPGRGAFVLARAVAAWLCRRHTEATPADLAEWLGLSRADSVPNLTRRLEAQLKSRPELLNDLAEILRRANDVPADHHQITRKTPKSKRRPGQSKTKNKG